jgi:PH domain
VLDTHIEHVVFTTQLYCTNHRAPEKSGWLKKQKTGHKTGGGTGTGGGVSLEAVGGPGGRPKKWKAMYFILAEGKLSWFNADGRDAKLQGVVSASCITTATCCC